MVTVLVFHLFDNQTRAPKPPFFYLTKNPAVCCWCWRMYSCSRRLYCCSRHLSTHLSTSLHWASKHWATYTISRPSCIRSWQLAPFTSLLW